MQNFEPDELYTFEKVAFITSTLQVSDQNIVVFFSSKSICYWGDMFDIRLAIPPKLNYHLNTGCRQKQSDFEYQYRNLRAERQITTFEASKG